MSHFFSHCLALTPAVFKDIVATWTFAGQGQDFKKDIYGIGHDNPDKTMFGNSQNNNAGDNNGANYIFRENTQTKSGGYFFDRFAEEYWTKDGVRLYIGGGSNQRNARLTIKETP
jgi:hypothetical protein